MVFEFLYYLLEEFLTPDCLCETPVLTIHHTRILTTIYTSEKCIDLDDEHGFTIEWEVIFHPDGSRQEVSISWWVERELRDDDVLGMIPELEFLAPHIDSSDEDRPCGIILKKSKLLPLASWYTLHEYLVSCLLEGTPYLSDVLGTGREYHSPSELSWSRESAYDRWVYYHMLLFLFLSACLYCTREPCFVA